MMVKKHLGKHKRIGFQNLRSPLQMKWIMLYLYSKIEVMDKEGSDGMNEQETGILLVEDEGSIRKFIGINMIRAGFKVFEAGSGEEALQMLPDCNPAVVVLDVMLPGMDGFEVCQKIRDIREDIAIIMLTAKAQDMDKIMGLELGADDYMVKPFNPQELVARIRAILRRADRYGNSEDESILFRNLKLDLRSQRLYKDGREMDLTPREYGLLKVFMNHRGTALSRDELLDMVWGTDYFGDVKTVDVHVRRLREKIEDNPSMPEFIETVWGYGYRWQK